VPALANAVGRLKAPLVLILDDFQELRAAGVSEQLDALLRHPPDNLRLAIVSRSDPRLSLHRLRLEGNLSDLRSADLAFTYDEAAALFELTDIELTADQLRALHERTEGWVAGLRLAALSLQACDDADELIRTFAGDERTVADYPRRGSVCSASRRRSGTSCCAQASVDVISPDLADALTRRADGALILERLERANAFVSCVDEQGPWYRYHGMFRELTRKSASSPHARGACCSAPARGALVREERAQLASRPARGCRPATGSSRPRCSRVDGSSCSSAAKQRPSRS